MADKEITLHFNVDADQAKSELAALSAQANAMKTANAPGAEDSPASPDVANSEQMELWARAIEAARGAMQQLADILKAENDELQLSADTSVALAEYYKEAQNAAQAFGQQLYKLEASAIDAGDAMEHSLLRKLEEMPPLLEDASRFLGELMARLGSGGEWEAVGEKVRALSEAYGTLAGNLWSVRDGMREVNDAGGGTSAELAEVIEILKRLAEQNERIISQTAKTKQAANESADAIRGMKDAMEPAAKASEDLSYAQSLLGKSVSELRAEYLRLADAIKAAAEKGDVELVNKLKEQQAAVQKQLRASTKELNIQRVSFSQAAQSAKMMGENVKSLVSDIGNFGDAAKKGELDIAGMATSVVSLAQSFMALPGPIGAAMVAIQAIQMGYNLGAQEYEQRLKIIREAEELRDTMRQARRNEALRFINEERQAEVKREQERINGYVQDRAASIRETQAAANANAEARKRELDEVDRHEKKLLAERMATASAEEKKALQQQLDAVEDASRRRQVEDAKNAARAAEANAENLKQQLQSPEVQKYLQLKVPSQEEYRKLLLDIAKEEAKGNSLTLERLKEQKVEFDKARYNFTQEVKKLDSTFLGGNDAAIELVEGIQRGARENEKTVEAFERTAKNARREAEAVEARAKNEQEELRKARARRDANDEVEIGLKNISRDTKTLGNYTERSSKTQYEIMLADRMQLRERLRMLRVLRASAGAADASKIEGLDTEIEATEKSLRGLRQGIDDSVPSLIKSLREGVVPQKELIAINPARQAEIDDVVKKMAARAAEIERLMRRQVDLRRRAVDGDVVAADEAEKVNAEIRRNRNIIAKDGEELNRRVLGSKAGTEYVRELNGSIKASEDEYKRLEAATRDSVRQEQENGRRRRADGSIQQTTNKAEQQTAKLQGEVEALRTQNEQMAQFVSSSTRALHGLKTSCETMAGLLSNAVAEIRALQVDVAALRDRVTKMQRNV